MADRYLRQTTTGHLYIWAAHYAEREDMEEVVRDDAGVFVPVDADAAPAVVEEAPAAAIPDAPKKRARKKVPADDVPPLFEE